MLPAALPSAWSIRNCELVNSCVKPLQPAWNESVGSQVALAAPSFAFAADSLARSDRRSGLPSSAASNSSPSSHSGWVMGNESTRVTDSGSLGAGMPMVWNRRSRSTITSCRACNSVTSDCPLATSACRTSSIVFWPTSKRACASRKNSSLRSSCFSDNSTCASDWRTARYCCLTVDSRLTSAPLIAACVASYCASETLGPMIVRPSSRADMVRP
jgi:hypothetical protein